MEIILIYTALILGGLGLGSFAGATVWRLRARQLTEDKKAGERINHEEYDRLKNLVGVSLLRDRSHCLHCGYTLKWYDLVPLASWIVLKGRCRHCHKKIGALEPLIELGVAVFFVLSYALWPFPLDTGLEVARLITWLVAGVGLAILTAYDTKWFLLPDRISFGVIGLGIVTAVLVLIDAPSASTIFSIVGSIAILSGLYLVLYTVSSGRWVGFGDVKLGLGLALLLSDWRLAFIALFVANVIGCLIVVPLLAAGRLKRNAHVPFGPLLIAGAVVALLVGHSVIEWYFGSLFI